MSRKTVSRSILALREAFPGFSGFSPRDNQSAKLLHLLRQAATRFRRAKAHPFYPMREVAEFFAVPFPTVARVYKRLETEGHLIRLRSAMTIIPARKLQSRIPVKAVVGLPVWLPGFLSLYEWRLFFIEIEEQLRQHDFVADFIFYREGENFHPSFAERLLDHQLDVLLWFTPQRQTLSNIQMVVERGVRAILIGPETRSLPGHHYLLNWDCALHEGIVAWKREGIARVVVPRSPSSTPYDRTVVLQALQQAGVTCEFATKAPETSADRYLAGLFSQTPPAIIFDDDAWCAHLCTEARGEMIRLFKTHRVMILRAVNLPASLVAGVPVDGVVMDWKYIVTQLVEDLQTGDAFAHPSPVEFQARWKPRADLSHFAMQF